MKLFFASFATLSLTMLTACGGAEFRPAPTSPEDTPPATIEPDAGDAATPPRSHLSDFALRLGACERWSQESDWKVCRMTGSDGVLRVYKTWSCDEDDHAGPFLNGEDALSTPIPDNACRRIYRTGTGSMIWCCGS